MEWDRMATWPYRCEVAITYPREIQQIDHTIPTIMIQAVVSILSKDVLCISTYFNIVHDISISIQINQVKYIYLSSPEDIHGYTMYFYVFFVYIHCSIDRWNISLFYLYFYIHHYPNSPKSKHILLTYIIYPLISVNYPIIIQWLSQDIHGLVSYIYTV